MESSITWCGNEYKVRAGSDDIIQEKKRSAHWGVDVKVLDLGLKFIHNGRDFLQVHGLQGFVQGLGHLTHAFSDLHNKRCH